MKIAAILVLALAVCAAQARRCPRYQFIVFSDTSKRARGLNKIVKSFRRHLGAIDNGNAPGPLNMGHRSINWDAGIVPFDMPGDFFDVNVTRGAFFAASGGKFAVSNPAVPPPVDDRFSSLLPMSQTKKFKTFSPLRLFTPVLKNKVTVQFKIPAQDLRAAVTAFGAVFTDVDLPRRTFMQFYDKNGCLIAKVLVPPRNKGLSFTGLCVLNPKNPKKQLPAIYRVVIKLGNVSVDKFADKYSRGSAPGDVVVLDDLIYGEPTTMM